MSPLDPLNEQFTKSMRPSSYQNCGLTVKLLPRLNTPFPVRKVKVQKREKDKLKNHFNKY
jgi:hypothetical protein